MTVPQILVNLYFLHSNWSRKWHHVTKAYSSCVGTGPFVTELFGKEADLIRKIAGEFGATTGRKRQVDWLDTDLIKKAIDINGVNVLIINKMDILEKVNVWNLYNQGSLINCKTEKQFKETIKDLFGKFVDKIIFSYSPYKI